MFKHCYLRLRSGYDLIGQLIEQSAMYKEVKFLLFVYNFCFLYTLQLNSENTDKKDCNQSIFQTSQDQVLPVLLFQRVKRKKGQMKKTY